MIDEKKLEELSHLHFEIWGSVTNEDQVRDTLSLALAVVRAAQQARQYYGEDWETLVGLKGLNAALAPFRAEEGK